MICVGIDVAKDKLDCFIIRLEGEVLADVFTVANNRDGFEALPWKIHTCTNPAGEIKAGLEAAGRCNCNILGFLLEKGLLTLLLQMNFYIARGFFHNGLEPFIRCKSEHKSTDRFIGCAEAAHRRSRLDP